MLVLTALPFGVAFVVALAFGPGVIAMLRRRKAGQVISTDGPESHHAKAGLPTMGGLIIIAGILGAVLLYSVLDARWELVDREIMRISDLAAVLLLMVGYGLVGMVDDYLTIRPVGGVRGIASKPKAAIQALLALAFILWLATHHAGGFLPALMVGNYTLLSGVPYWIFAGLMLVGMSNFVNITDGLDGLVSGLSAIATTVLTVCVLMLRGGIADQVDLTLVSLLPAISGACLAFLWFNANPAKVFMGDTGSMALGVALPAIAILMHREVLMIVICLVFVLDGLSSALQWAVFKFTRITTGTGRRVFKKSPIHHHFELSGWPEQTVVVRFWILGAVAAVIGFAGAAARIW